MKETTKFIERLSIYPGAMADFLENLPDLAAERGRVLIFVDTFFEKSALADQIEGHSFVTLTLCDSRKEPTTDQIDLHVAEYLKINEQPPGVVVGIGGGSTLDTAKAVSNVFGNGGRAEDYQGWDLLSKPGIYKIGIPTLSGTGAEASRTCVLLNVKKNLKLGMNSEFSIFDRLVLDPDLSSTVPRDQYFYTGMDTYIHCVESLAGARRHPMADAFSREALNLCRKIFLESDDMMTPENRQDLMVASFLGGTAIANSFVGVVHPFSAGLSVVLGAHHCVANCIVMDKMDEFYANEVEEFRRMREKQGAKVPAGLCKDLSEDEYERLYLSTIVHEKPLVNALGDAFKDVLHRDKVVKVFRTM